MSVDGGAIKYVYDANGQRVEKTVNGVSVDYLSDLAGHPMVEVSSSGGVDRDEIYAGNRHVATYANSTTYFEANDWLGTERVRTNMSGSLCESIASLPFGDGQTTTGSCADASPMHFTGKQRDTETNLDDFGARYNSSNLGRFMSPDWSAKPTSVPYAAFGDPQSLNLYSYVGNHPLLHFDPDGHCWPIGACVAAATRTLKQMAESPRVQMAGQGLLNSFVGVAKGGATMIAVGGTEYGSGGVATPVAAAEAGYGLLSSAGNMVAGTAQILGAITGRTEEAQKTADFAGTMSTASGLLTFAVTGDFDKAQTAAAAEELATFNPRSLSEGRALEKTVASGDTFNALKDTFGVLKSLLRPSGTQPPAMPAPPPPPCVEGNPTACGLISSYSSH